jgi:hypothetical protein
MILGNLSGARINRQLLIIVEVTEQGNDGMPLTLVSAANAKNWSMPLISCHAHRVADEKNRPTSSLGSFERIDRTLIHSFSSTDSHNERLKSIL